MRSPLLSAWLLTVLGLSTAAAEPEFRSLYNGRDLTGWRGIETLWRPGEKLIAGVSPGLAENHFLSTQEEFGDFELRFEVKLYDDRANSGVQFRSRRDPHSTEMIGYQADIGAGVWGGVYDESRRRKFVAPPDPEAVRKAVKVGDWNTYVVRAQGPHITLSINGVTTADYRETDPSIPQTGVIALQVHAGDPFRVEFRNLQIRALPPAQ